MWVRAKAGRERRADTVDVLCGHCHSERSRKLFYKNHPNAGPGWAKTRAEDLRALGIAPRKRRRPKKELVLTAEELDAIEYGKTHARKKPRLGPTD